MPFASSPSPRSRVKKTPRLRSGSRRQPSQNGVNRNDVTSCGEGREKDQGWRVRKQGELRPPEAPADQQVPVPSGEERRHQESRLCDAGPTGRGRCRNAHAHRGQPPPTRGGHPAPLQTVQKRATGRQDQSPSCSEVDKTSGVWSRVELSRASYLT